MTNAAKPRLIRSGWSHHLSVRSVFSPMWARVGEKTPESERFAAGALIYCVPLRTGCRSKGTQKVSPLISRASLLRAVVTSDTLVVDIAPEIAVVLGVWDCDLLAGLVHSGSRQI